MIRLAAFSAAALAVAHAAAFAGADPLPLPQPPGTAGSGRMNPMKPMEATARKEFLAQISRYERRTQRKVAYTLDRKSPTPYFDLTHGPFYLTLQRITLDNEAAERIERVAKSWRRALPHRPFPIHLDPKAEYPATRIKDESPALFLNAAHEIYAAESWADFQASMVRTKQITYDELKLDPASAFPYSEAMTKYGALVEARNHEHAFRERYERVVGDYVQRTGKPARMDLDAQSSTPYTDACRKQPERLAMMERENYLAHHWDDLAWDWAPRGVVSKDEVRPDPAVDFPYVEADALYQRLRKARTAERDARRRIEQSIAAYRGRMGRLPSGYVDPSQTGGEYPYSAALEAQKSLFNSLTAEETRANEWPTNVRTWTKDGLIRNDEVRLDLALDFPYTAATAEIGGIWNDREAERGSRLLVLALAEFYRGVNRPALAEALLPEPGNPRAWRNLHARNALAIDRLPAELEAKADLELLRDVQIAAHDPDVVELPPKTFDEPSYVKLEKAVAKLFDKYRDAIATRRLDAFTERLRERVLTVERPFHTWHWGSRERLGPAWQKPRSASDPDGAELVRSGVASYYDIASKTGTNRDGYYAAVDPLSTRGYGGSDWFLARLELPKGARLLDLPALNRDDALTSELNHVLKENGCGYYAAGNFDALLVRHPASDRCNEAARRILGKLRIDTILYFYPHANFEGCKSSSPDTKPGLSGAFVFAGGGGDRIRPEHVRIFTADTRDATEERAMIAGLMHEAGSSYVASGLWPDLKTEPTADDRAAWRKEHMVTCGEFARYVPEPPPAAASAATVAAPSCARGADAVAPAAEGWMKQLCDTVK